MTILQEPDSGLTRDTALMSDVLDDVLVEQAGTILAGRVRWLSRTAAALRAGDAAAWGPNRPSAVLRP